MDGWNDGSACMDGQKDGRMKGWMDGSMEVQEWMDFFDTNGDGYLTLSEIYPSPLMPADLDAGAQVEFDVFDANNDGQIEASEFVNFFVAYDNAS